MNTVPLFVLQHAHDALTRVAAADKAAPIKQLDPVTWAKVTHSKNELASFLSCLTSDPVEVSK